MQYPLKSEQQDRVYYTIYSHLERYVLVSKYNATSTRTCDTNNNNNIFLSVKNRRVGKGGVKTIFRVRIF